MNNIGNLLVRLFFYFAVNIPLFSHDCIPFRSRSRSVFLRLQLRLRLRANRFGGSGSGSGSASLCSTINSKHRNYFFDIQHDSNSKNNRQVKAPAWVDSVTSSIPNGLQKRNLDRPIITGLKLSFTAPELYRVHQTNVSTFPHNRDWTLRAD